MKYLVTGADRKTGHDISLTIDATDKTDAAERAMAMGMVIADVDPAEPPIQVSQEPDWRKLQSVIEAGVCRGAIRRGCPRAK